MGTILISWNFYDFYFKAHSKSKSFYDILLQLNIIKLFHGLDETLIDYSLQDVNFAVILQFTTDNKIFIKSILVFDIYWLIEASSRPVQNSYACKLWYTERKKLSHFDIKSWVTCGTKIRPGKVGNWRIFESNWVIIENLIDSTLRVKLIQHWQSNWLNIESQIGSTMRVKLTKHWESNCLNIESQIDSTLRVKLTQHWKSNWLNIESQIDSTLRVKLTQHWESNWLNIESQIDSTLRVKLTQHWESNWLNIESQIDSTLRVKLTQHWESN